MLLTRSIFVLMISMFCVVHNAVADCTSGKTTLKDGKQFTEPVNLKKCESLQAQITDKKANSFKLSCNKTKFKCTAYACPNNTVLNRNGICSETDSTQPDEQSRFHKKLLTYTDQTRNFFDACTNFSSENAKDRTIKETQSVIKEIGNKIKYACITDFANVKISTALAIGVIERYNWSNGIGQIRADSCTTQQNNRFKSGAGRSIRCVSDNGIFVEFVFGKMDSLSTSREDVAEAMCPTFGFSHLDSNGNRHRCHKKDKNKSSKDLAEFLKKNELMDVKNLDNGYIEILPLHPNIETKDNLSKILYTDEFKNIITYATAQTRNLLKKYIKTRLKAAGYEVNRIRFFSARSNAFYTADGSSWPVEIEACKNNDCKTYYKVFKFKSLFGSPGNDLHFASWVALSVEQMACIIKDGLFDSKHCFFLEEDINKEKQMCAETNSLIQSTFAKPSNNAKAEFDTENNMCVLHSSNINAKTLKGLGIAAQVGLLAVTTVATAGVGTALGIGLAAGGLLADGVTLWADVQMNKASMKFLKLSTRCYDKTCAKKYFEEEFKHMLQLMDRINDDEYKVIDSEMDRLVNLFADDEKYLNKYVTELANLKEKTTGFFNNMSTEETIETVAMVVSVALSITNATKPIKALIAKSKKVEPKFIKTLANKLNTKEAIPTATKTAGKTNDATKNATKTVTNIADVRKKALVNFDESLNKLKNDDITEFFVPKSNLTEEELTVLVQDLKKQGLEVEEYGSGALRVKKTGTGTKPVVDGISGAYAKLDAEHREVVDRLNEITRREDWEYKTAQELGSTDGAYRINLGHMDVTMEEERALINKFEKANIKFKIEIGKGRDRYLVINEQDISDIGKIKPVSVIVDEAKKNGADFLGKLKGWKVDKVEQMTDNYRNSVFKFKETNSGKTYYLKHTDNMDEITRTKRAAEILHDDSGIVHTVKVIEDDQDVLIDFAAKNNLLQKSSGEYWFLTEEVPTSKTPWEMLSSKNSLKDVLRGKPITVAEQKEIRQAVNKLNSGGITHGDLEHNMFFMREPNGKLRVDIIDYEKADDFVSFVDDKKWLDDTFDKLNKAGLSEEVRVVGAEKTSRTTETVNKTQVFAETSQTSMRNTASINIQDIRMKANKNFDRDLNYIQNGQTERFYVKKTNLSDEEWKILREDLNKKGFDIAESDDPASFWITKKASNSDNIIKINSGDVGDYLSRSKTLQNLNGQGRLNLQTSKTLNGKQYMRISMGTNPDMQETQKLIRELQNEGFYVSSNSTKGGEKFIGVSRENIFEPWAKAKSNWLLNNADNVVYTEKTASKSTAVTTTKPKAPTINKEPSLSEIDDMYQQKLSDDVLTLQQSQDMGQKVDKYNDVLNRAKKSLSPEEYKTFENMLDYETTIRNQESYISQVEQNLRRNGFSEHTIDSYINDTREALAENKMKLRNMRKTNPEAAEFLDDNYSSLMDPHSIITQSDNALIQKKVNMTAEISKHVDDVALRKGVEQFKSDIIANFPESMYQKAKNWDNISGEDKANFIAKELIPYLEKIQGVNGTEIEIKLLPRSHIGGNAAFCDKTNCIQVSFEAINETRFEDVLTSLIHETVHAGQYIDGGRSLLTKEMVNLSDNNYVAALINLGANKANAVEREAYMTEGMFNNILDEIARYHNW